MELLSPAGTLEKLEYAYAYGADAAYVGMQEFSLRSRAGNIDDSQVDQLKKVKGDKKLYGALNSFFHEKDVGLLKERLAVIKSYPFDALIVSDIGAAALLRDYFGEAMPLHLSTQANCLIVQQLRSTAIWGFHALLWGEKLHSKI
jgi:putative protease